jgi:hypothetical protein
MQWACPPQQSWGKSKRDAGGRVGNSVQLKICIPTPLWAIVHSRGKVFNRMVPMNESSMRGVVTEVYRSSAPYSGGLRCGGGGCPAVYETEQGTFFIVGRRLTAEEKAKLPMDAIEDALEVPADLLQGVLKKLGN